MFGTIGVPKFEEDLFRVPRSDGAFVLIPTAEVPVTNIVRDEILAAETLPIKYVSPHAMLPFRSGFVWPRHARHDSSAPVRQG